jgi:hypothetical protein
VGVPRTARSLVRRLCELGWLFRRLSAFLAASAKATSSSLTSARPAYGAPPPLLGGGGSLAQAFCGALQQELVDFYRLMAVLEAQVCGKLRTPCSEASGTRRVAQCAWWPPETSPLIFERSRDELPAKSQVAVVELKRRAETHGPDHIVVGAPSSACGLVTPNVLRVE